jgi:hypothetical protein
VVHLSVSKRREKRNGLALPVVNAQSRPLVRDCFLRQRRVLDVSGFPPGKPTMCRDDARGDYGVQPSSHERRVLDDPEPSVSCDSLVLTV